MSSKLLKISALALLAGVTSGYASKLQDGMYVGVSHAFNNLQLDGQATDTVVSLKGKKNDRYYGGAEGRVFAGYEDRWGSSCFVWGTELFASFHNTDTGRIVDYIGGNTSYTRVNQEYSGGLKLKAGWGINDNTTWYAHVSAINTRFKIEHAPGDGGLLGGGYVGSNLSKNLWAIAPGLGMKVGLDKNWSLHGDAYYAFYQSFKKDLSGDGGGHTYTFKMNPKQLGISVGVSYKINPSHD
ncbi:MAG: outer membrane protein [Alphaproteobacteria bacterium]